MLEWRIFREEPTEETIKEFADYSNLDFHIAKKYFSHICKDCGKKIKSKEVLAMNMKFYGRQTTKFYCKKHLKEKLNITEEEWKNYVSIFKEQGCSLF